MNDIAIIGGGGFGREVQWLIDRINSQEKAWNLIGYIDDSIKAGTLINGIPVLGGVDLLLNCTENLAVTCAIGSSATRKRVMERVMFNKNISFPNSIDPSVLISDRLKLGQGTIICAGSIITVNITIKDFVIINLDCTVGHDAVLESYVTMYPSVNISGNVILEEAVEMGTGSQIIQGKRIIRNSIVGAGAVVVNDLTEPGTYVGVPARRVNK